MQIVIDISEDVYERFGFEYIEKNFISKYTTDAILDAFCEGTLLPKGHGRLIDADALEGEPYLISKGNGMYDETIGYFHINDAPTIIEADKEQE